MSWLLSIASRAWIAIICALVTAQCAAAAPFSQVIVVGSIAGDRGKEKNPVYDSSKAGLEVLCQGYRQRFAHRNTRLLFVKPGNVSTRMTKDKAKDWTFSRPERIASDVYRAMDRGGGVIYSPRIWGAVMFVIRKLPETLFVKMGFGRAN